MFTVCGFAGVCIVAKHIDPSPWPFTQQQAAEILRNLPVGFGWDPVLLS